MRGTQPTWVADYVDRGRPDQVVDYGRLNRTRSQLPRVIRPDLFLTEAGFVATELDSVPGGIGFSASLADLHRARVSPRRGGEGMLEGFAGMVAGRAGEEPPYGNRRLRRSGDYWEEMAWLAARYGNAGTPSTPSVPRTCTSPRRPCSSPEGAPPARAMGTRRRPAPPGPHQGAVPLLRAVRRQERPQVGADALRVEKTARRHHPAGQELPRRKAVLRPAAPSRAGDLLGARAEGERCERLRRVLPPTWILDPRPLPPTPPSPGCREASRCRIGSSSSD